MYQRSCLGDERHLESPASLHTFAARGRHQRGLASRQSADVAVPSKSILGFMSMKLQLSIATALSKSVVQQAGAACIQGVDFTIGSAPHVWLHLQLVHPSRLLL